jgi:outer membrane protein OmpA-like peptidoglycan-associated protein
MKKSVIIFAMCCTASLCFGQKALKKANDLANQFRYVEAVQLYNQILAEEPQNKIALEGIVRCYGRLNDPVNSEKWLSKLCASENADPHYLKLYGESLAANNKHKEALLSYQRYLAVVKDRELDQKVKVLNSMAIFYVDSAFVKVKPALFNSEASDFSPIYYKNGILFCSARDHSKTREKYSWDNSAFIDLFYSDNGEKEVVSIGKPINSSLHEGPATVSFSGDTLYFTRNKLPKGNNSSNSGDVVRLEIYAVFKKGEGGWSKEVAFELNDKNFSTGHPAITKDGKMYFVSDMPGGYGGTDLYVTSKNNGRWTTPQNLGAKINTSGNEMFPFVDDQGNLYFSSNALPGLGGLDIFKASFGQSGFSEPVNVGYPINSSRDDFSLISKGNTGFFSSNRDGKPNDDNIFSFTLTKSRKLKIQAVSANEKVQDFTIQVFKNNSLLVEERVENLYENTLNADHEYKIMVHKNGFHPGSVTIKKIDLAKLADGSLLSIELKRKSKKVVIALQTSDRKRIAYGNIEVRKQNEAAVIFDSGKNGLLEIELDPSSPYEITASRVNYKSSFLSLSIDQIRDLADSSLLTLTLQVPPTLFEKNEIGQVIELDIKYDVNKFNIRKDAARELEKLIIYLKKNPNVKVELGSHTDSRGSAAANMKLSQKRAASAAQFIVAKGISSSRIIPVGYGKDDLKIVNAASEDDHQQNRRTTVKIVGI